ncbi:molybdopterin cofactor-binding domain-containing protein [Escherichia coli]
MAVWDGNKLTLWTSNQMIDWCHTNLAKTLKVPVENVRIISPYIGREFWRQAVPEKRCAAGGPRRPSGETSG